MQSSLGISSRRNNNNDMKLNYSKCFYPIISGNTIKYILVGVQVVLIKVVHYCIKIILKLVRPKFDIHRCVFLGRAHRARSPAS